METFSHALTLIGAIVFLTSLCCYMSLGETTISSVSEARARACTESEPWLAGLINWELKQRQQAIITILVAHNLFSVAASSLATVLALSLWGQSGVLWSTVAITVLMVLFADFLPKCAGMVLGERAFAFVLPGLRFLAVILRPPVWLLEKTVAFLGRCCGVNMMFDGASVTRDEIEQLVKTGEESGAIEASERRMIDGVISFDETRVSEIMVPRVSMDALEVGESVQRVMSDILRWEHSRIPVYRGTPDDIAGVLYAKDIMACLQEQRGDTLLGALVREALFVPATMRVHDVFDIMKQRRMHFAVVVDEYGGTAGIVTLEDVLEEIFGEIQDEYDDDKKVIPVERIAKNVFKVQCSMLLEDLETALNCDFHCESVDSVGGYVLERFGDFPRVGDVIAATDAEPWEIEVTSVSGHRVNEVILKRNA